MSKPGQFLITLSGARPDILAFCPGEKTKFQSLAWVILITTGMAVMSMWFALTTTLGVNGFIAAPAALLWGLVIMGIDRWLVTSMPHDRSRKYLMAIPRLGLALLLGSVISTPFVLRIFASEINNQVSVIKENNEAAFLNSQQRSTVGARVTKWQNTVSSLQKVINSHGAQPINPVDDPVIQGLNTELTNERKAAAADYKAWQCQLYGGCGAPKGSGPLAQASKKQYDADEAQITSLTRQISNRKQQLQASDTSSQASRLQQAQRALPNAQAQLKSAQAEQNSLLDNFQVTNSATNGLLIKLEALDQLSVKGGSLAAARWLLFLLFLAIELLPVSVKLMQRPGVYEQILEEKDRYVLREAKWRLRSGSGAVPTQAEPPAGPSPGSGFMPRPPSRHVSTGELMQLFEQTQTAPPPAFRPSPDAAYEPTRDSDGPWHKPSADRPNITGAGRLDEQFSRLDDNQAGGEVYGKYGDFDVPSNGYGTDDDRRSAIERIYSDDDL